MREIIFLALVFFQISLISSLCESGQIDINSADESELDGLAGIGEVKAKEIVNSRPFESVDELINVKGIGEATLQKIKDQGLACVESESKDETEENNLSEETETEEDSEKENLEDEEETNEEKVEEEINEDFESKENIIAEPIILTGKDIKTEENTEIRTGRYAIYGFVVFCVLISALFVLKFRKRRYKNEFE